MNSREPSDLPPASSYPTGQGAMYYGGRQLTADEILTAELSRDAASNNLADGSANGMFFSAARCFSVRCSHLSRGHLKFCY
jgi:hypothetical protein